MAKYVDYLHALECELNAGSLPVPSHFLIMQEAHASRREREIETTIALEASIEVFYPYTLRPHTYVLSNSSPLNLYVGVCCVYMFFAGSSR